MRTTLSPPLGAGAGYEDTDTVLVDVDYLARMMADPDPPPGPRVLGQVYASADYMQRVVDASALERRARLGRRAP